MSEGLAFLLLLLGCLAWLLLPLAPALRELLRPTDAAPLAMVGQDAGDLTFFADRFRAYLREQLGERHADGALAPNGRLPDGTPWVRAGSDQVPRTPSHVDALVLADPGAVLPPDGVYAMEVYARGELTCGARSIVRALLSDAECRMGDEVDVLRWVHADGVLRIGSGSTLHGRGTSDAAIHLGAGVRFARLRAPRIAALNTAAAEAPHRIGSSGVSEPLTRFDPPGAVRLGDGRLRVDGSLHVPARSTVAEHLVVRGDLHVGPGARLDGAIKAHGSVTLAEGAVVRGAVVARLDVHAQRGVWVAGAVIAERAVILSADVVVGSPAQPTTVAAPCVRLEPGAVVYGAVTTEDGAVLSIAAA
jgi:cytoskeletal protein CcmA (bactofilin family)